MQWLDAAPAIACALFVLLGPGMVLGWALPARGFTLIAIAPLLSVSLIAVGAIIAPLVSVPWSILPVAVLTLLAGLVVWGLRTIINRRNPPEAMARLWTADSTSALLGVAVAAVLIGTRMLYAVGSPGNISQTFDNIFHLNAIAYIEHTQEASSLTVGSMTGIPFYPAAWHAVVALTQQLSGAPIPVAVNATNLIIGAGVWPLGSILLCRQLIGTSRLAMVVAGTMSAAFGAFPLMMADFGVLYPNLLSIALLPGMLALGIWVLGLSTTNELPKVMSWAALVIASPGMALAHPSTFMAFLAILVPAVVYVFARSWIRWRLDWNANRRRSVAWSIALAACFVALVVAWQSIRPDSAASFWPPINSPAGSLWGLVTNSLMNRPPALMVSILIVVGIAVLVRRRQWWLLGSFAVVCFLYEVVSSFRPGRLRDFLTGVWYNDSYRLAALVPTLALVLASVGTIWIIGYLRSKLRHRGHSSVPAKILTFGAAGLVVVLTQFGNVQYATDSAHRNYELRADSPLISSDEMAVLKDMPALVPENAVVAANPWNGSALAYALAGRTTIELHVLSSNMRPEDAVVLAHLREARTDPTVCPAAHALGVGYVLDFGRQEVNGGSHPAPGLDNLAESGTVTLLSQHGEAKLFKFNACG